MPRAAPLPRTPDSASGFTLLEMLVVLAITGLIAGLLYPQLETARFAVRQRLAREQVSAAVEAARSAARRSGAPVSLSADTGALVIAGTRRIAITSTGSQPLALQPQAILFYPDGSTTGGQVVFGTGRDRTAFAIARAGGQLLTGNGG